VNERLPRAFAPFVAQISINEVMVTQTDHASHFILEAANSKNTALKNQWREVGHHAIDL
jgi:hypothetical protein